MYPADFTNYKDETTLSKRLKTLSKCIKKHPEIPGHSLYMELDQYMNAVRLHGNLLVHAGSFWYVAEIDPVDIIAPMAKMLKIANDLGLFRRNSK